MQAPNSQVEADRVGHTRVCNWCAQAAVVEAPSVNLVSAANSLNLRSLLLGGDFFLGGVIAGTLTKLALRMRTFAGASGGWHPAAAVLCR